MSNPLIARQHAASRARVAACAGALALAAAALLAACAMPKHPDADAAPSDPFNPAAVQLLDDTSWTLVQATTATGQSLDAATQTDGQGPAKLAFSTSTGQRRASGFDGCNRFAGSYDLKNGVLSFGPLIATRMACTGARNALEQAFLDALAHIAKTGVQMKPPQTLEIVATDGTRLKFARERQ
jgi:heat shock protein HslJ